MRFKQKIWYTRQGNYGLSGLEKIIAFQEVKLLAENLCQEWKSEYFPIVEDHLIQKHWNIAIRCLAYSQRLHSWLVAEISLVWQTKNGRVLDQKAAPGYHKIANCIIKHN